MTILDHLVQYTFRQYPGNSLEASHHEVKRFHDFETSLAISCSEPGTFGSSCPNFDML